MGTYNARKRLISDGEKIRTVMETDDWYRIAERLKATTNHMLELNGEMSRGVPDEWDSLGNVLLYLDNLRIRAYQEMASEHGREAAGALFYPRPDESYGPGDTDGLWDNVPLRFAVTGE